MDDLSILQDAIAGDKIAFGRVIEKYQRLVLALAAYYVGIVDGQDAAQEVWLVVCRKLWQLRDADRFVPWLKKLVFYQCLNWRKARVRLEPEVQLSHEDWVVLFRTVADSEFSLDEALEKQEMRKYLSALLDSLPADYGMMLKLHYYGELSLYEISSLTQLPVSTIRGRLYQGRQILRARLLRNLRRDSNEKSG